MIRMKLDLVLLADRSKPALLTGLPGVTERLIPRTGLDGHFGTHDPEIWRSNGLDQFVRDDWLPSLGSLP